MSDSLRMTYEANDALCEKSIAIINGASLCLAAISLVTVLPESRNWLCYALAVAAGMVVFGMVCLAGSVWVPSDVRIPGTNNVDDLFKNYLTKDINSAFNLAIGRVESVRDHERERNALLAKRVRIMIVCLDALVLLLVVIISLNWAV